MKKTFFLIAATVVSAMSFAQITFGVQATGNLSTASVGDYEDAVYRKSFRALPGAGAGVQYDFSKNVAIRSGVNFLQSGTTIKTKLEGESTVNLKLQSKLNYVQVPVHLIYQVPVGGLRLYAGGGAYWNYGVSGSSSLTTTDEEGSIVEKIKAFKKQDKGGLGFKRSDVGVSAIAGLKLPNGLFANVGYQLGLSNLDPDANSTYRNRGLQLTVGYFF